MRASPDPRRRVSGPDIGGQVRYDLVTVIAMRSLSRLLLWCVLFVGCRDDWPGDFQIDAGFLPPFDAGIVDTGATAPDVGFPYSFAADVQPILAAKCWGCHGVTTANLAPRSLVTVQDLTMTDPATGQPVHQLVAARVASNVLPMPPPSSGISLSATEIAIITTWSATGAP